MVSEQVVLSLISTLGGIIICYITMTQRAKAVENKEKGKPKDRLDLAFELYEKLLREQQSDIDRKTIVIAHFEELVVKYRKDSETLRGQIEELQNEIDTLKFELAEEKKSRDKLEKEIAGMRERFEKKAKKK